MCARKKKKKNHSQIQAGMDCMCIRLAFICVGRGWVEACPLGHLLHELWAYGKRQICNAQASRCDAVGWLRVRNGTLNGQDWSCHIFMPCLSRMQKCRNIYVPLRISKQQTAKQQRVVAVVHWTLLKKKKKVEKETKRKGNAGCQGSNVFYWMKWRAWRWFINVAKTQEQQQQQQQAVTGSKQPYANAEADLRIE